MTLLQTFATNGYKKEIYQLFEKFKDGGTLKLWMNEVVHTANTIFQLDEEELRQEGYADEEIAEEFKRQVNDKNKFKGDCLEILSEIFFNQHQSDERVGIREYKSVPTNEDYGVDATGVNVAGNDCVNQIKWRNNPQDLIEYSDLAKTYTSGRTQFSLDLDKSNTIFVFTTANGVNHVAKKVLAERLVVVDRKFIKRLIDNNKTFWLIAHEMILNTINSL